MMKSDSKKDRQEKRARVESAESTDTSTEKEPVNAQNIGIDIDNVAQQVFKSHSLNNIIEQLEWQDERIVIGRGK